MLTQCVLLLLSLLTMLLAIVTVPGQDDLTSTNVRSLIAFNLATWGDFTFTTSVLLSVISTLQGITVSCCAAVFLQHFARVLMQNSGAVTFATLDVVMQSDYLQLARQLRKGPNANIVLLGVLSLAALCLVQGGHFAIQSFAYDSPFSSLSPYSANILFKNTSSIDPTLLTPSTTSTTAAPSDDLFIYFSESMLTVANDCVNGVCGAKSISPSPLITCADANATACTHAVPIYTDYDVQCVSTVSATPAGTQPFHCEIDPFTPPLSMGKYTTIPNVQWNVYMKQPDSKTLLHVNCTLYAARSIRVENSVTGTVEIRDRVVYNALPMSQYAGSTFDPAFVTQQNCSNLPAPLCMLFLVGQVLNAPWSGTSQDKRQNDTAGWGLSTLTIPIRKTGMQSVQAVARDLETYMKFFFETVVKRMMAVHDEGASVRDTCVECAFMPASVTQKSRLLAFVICVNTFGAALMIASIVMGFKTGVAYESFTAVEVARLPVQSGDVKSAVERSIGDEGVQFEVGIEVEVGSLGRKGVRVYGSEVGDSELIPLKSYA
ncbi:hypothetical protein HDU98_010713 [Podochytrium sp. JEL0797]|nr:hypothetical protein HDU98_010713 [Podochytrium sp. JEL0797]